jgi:hypothetical protein
MVSTKLLMLTFIATIAMSSGCDKTFASNNTEIKGAVATEPSASEVRLHGKFKRSFEIYELDSDSIIYYVSDPKQLLMKYSKKINQNAYYKYFDVCIVGSISPKGSYGSLGKYQKKITVREICA